MTVEVGIGTKRGDGEGCCFDEDGTGIFVSAVDGCSQQGSLNGQGSFALVTDAEALELEFGLEFCDGGADG